MVNMATEKTITLKYTTTNSSKQIEEKVNPDDIIPEKLYPSNNCHITSLDLSHNCLNDLPESLLELTHLKKLNLSHNNFDFLPDVFYLGLFRIEDLNFSHNKLKDFPPPNCILSLSVLNVSYNQLDLMPSWIWERSCRLRELELSGNPFDMRLYGIMFKTPMSISRLTKLVLCNSNFSNCDKRILTRIPYLIYLDIGNSDTDEKRLNGWQFPITELNCKNNLKYLRARNLHLAVLPENISELKRLHSIDLGKNYLHWLPETFYDLSTLSICNLESNSLSFLSKNINKLVNLTELYLADNNLTSLPDLDLPNLRVLDVYRNNIEILEDGIVNQVAEIDAEENFVETSELCRLKTEKFRTRLRIDNRSYGFIPRFNSSDCDLGGDVSSYQSSGDEDVVDKFDDAHVNLKWDHVEEEESWGDCNYLDDNFIPVTTIFSRRESPVTPKSITPDVEERYLELFTIFEDAD